MMKIKRYFQTQENQFVPEREGYTNDVICEGAGIIRDGGIIQKKSMSRKNQTNFTDIEFIQVEKG